MAFLSEKEGRIVSQGGKGRKLTQKMMTFIDAYFGDGEFNAIKSVKLSAYKTSTDASVAALAQELMTHPLVTAEIRRRTDLRYEKHEVKAEWLLMKLTNIVNNTEVDNPQAALRGIELLGKTLGIFRDRQEISGPDGGAIQTEQRVKEDIADFTTRITSLVKRTNVSSRDVGTPIRDGAANVVEFPNAGSPSSA